jgi:hypothetical protein
LFSRNYAGTFLGSSFLLLLLQPIVVSHKGSFPCGRNRPVGRLATVEYRALYQSQ